MHLLPICALKANVKRHSWLTGFNRLRDLNVAVYMYFSCSVTNMPVGILVDEPWEVQYSTTFENLSAESVKNAVNTLIVVYSLSHLGLALQR